jgi:hypothetical protein
MSFTKLENRRVERFLPGEIGNSGMGKEVQKGHRRVNIVQILCPHEYEWRNDIC